jgi:hypothetical protein
MLHHITINHEVVIQPAPYQSVRCGVEVSHEVGRGESATAVREQADAEVSEALIRRLAGTVNTLDEEQASLWRERLGMPAPERSQDIIDYAAFYPDGDGSDLVDGDAGEPDDEEDFDEEDEDDFDDDEEDEDDFDDDEEDEDDFDDDDDFEGDNWGDDDSF